MQSGSDRKRTWVSVNNIRNSDTNPWSVWCPTSTLVRMPNGTNSDSDKSHTIIPRCCNLLVGVAGLLAEWEHQSLYAWWVSRYACRQRYSRTAFVSSDGNGALGYSRDHSLLRKVWLAYNEMVLEKSNAKVLSWKSTNFSATQLIIYILYKTSNIYL